MVASAFRKALAPLQAPPLAATLPRAAPAASSSSFPPLAPSPKSHISARARRLRSLSALATHSGSSSAAAPSSSSDGGGTGRRPAPARAVAEAPPATSSASSTARGAGGRGGNETRAVTGPSLSLASAPPEEPPTYVDDAGRRIVAIGDIHGDLGKAIASLELAGVLSQDERARPAWCGGDTVVVQLGDVLDRGDNEIGVIMLLRELDAQAREEGGAVYMLNGNHESLNVCGDFRYATPGGFREAALAAGLRGEASSALDAQLRARLALYAPGGPMALELALNPTVLVVGRTMFAHGGIMPSHVAYGLEKLNADVAAWMRGDRRSDGSAAPPPFLAMGDASSVMWNRSYGKERYASQAERAGACRQLKAALDAAGCDRLVVGHTPQLGGANCECGGMVWRLDVGMSSGVLNARPAVLELPRGGRAGDEPRVLVVGGPACTLPPPIVQREGKGGGKRSGGSDGVLPGVKAGRRGLGNLVRGRTMAPP